MPLADARVWAERVWPKIEAKVAAECGRWGARIPYIARDGRYTDMWESEPAWWTNGFWAGILWLLYEVTRDGAYLAAARGVEDKFDVLFDRYVGLHHDVGFMWMTTAALDADLTGSERAKTRALHAAGILAGRYNPRGRFIRAWNGTGQEGWVIIDSMMNLSLLYWASEHSGDLRFRFVAMESADTALAALLRADGSCNHIASLDPSTGAVLEWPAGQGFASGSSWTRGQAWALYGFAVSASHTGEERYLAAAKRAANYFVAQVQAHDWIPPVDFRGPAGAAAVKDSSAGVIAASGLLQLAEEAPDEAERVFYRDAALRLLRAVEERCCDWEPERDSLVQEGAVAYHAGEDGFHVPLIYADYFFIEAVHRILKPGFRVW